MRAFDTLGRGLDEERIYGNGPGSGTSKDGERQEVRAGKQ